MFAFSYRILTGIQEFYGILQYIKTQSHVMVIAQLCPRRGLRKTRGKYVRAGIPWVESKSKLAAQSPIISLPNKLNTRFIYSSLHKQARDNSKVTLVTQFSIFNSIARFRKISLPYLLMI